MGGPPLLKRKSTYVQNLYTVFFNKQRPCSRSCFTRGRRPRVLAVLRGGGSEWDSEDVMMFSVDRPVFRLDMDMGCSRSDECESVTDRSIGVDLGRLEICRSVTYSEKVESSYHC